MLVCIECGSDNLIKCKCHEEEEPSIKCLDCGEQFDCCGAAIRKEK